METKPNTITDYFVSFFSSEPEAIASAGTRAMEALLKGSICVAISEEDRVTLKPHTRFLTEDPTAPRPFIVSNGNLYLYRYYQYETSIIQKIRTLVNMEETVLRERLAFLQQSPYFAQLVKEAAKGATDWQLMASLLSYLQNFSIITGGPGTGKTTTLVKVLNIILEENPHAKVKLAAPTGKAAARMKEAIKGQVPTLDESDALSASTIHRLLGYIHLSPYFKHGAENPLDADVVIVDEASMIDVALFSKLLNAIGNNTRLILLGDQNQLASVDAGSLFGDLCESVAHQNQLTGYILDAVNKLNINYAASNTAQQQPAMLQNNLIALQISYRFKEDEAISMLSKAVIAGEPEKVTEILAQLPHDSQVKQVAEMSSTELERFAESFKAYLSCTDIKEALETFNQQRILCALRRGKYGVEQLNIDIERMLHKEKHIRLDHEFYENRPVMVTKNYHDLKLYNGDVGLVRTVDGVKRIWFLDENNEVRGISPGYIAEVETNFAMTIHKSQGSEFDRVMVVLPSKEDVEILTRELLYTGITRAKNELLLIGSQTVIGHTVQRKVQRASGIAKRLN